MGQSTVGECLIWMMLDREMCSINQISHGQWAIAVFSHDGIFISEITVKVTVYSTYCYVNTIVHVRFILIFKMFFFLMFYFRTLLQLGELLWEKNIPLLVCRCYGFIGFMRLIAREHTGQ